jgi:molybdopterin/thiamine biosynthesis adenylyltransferase
MRGRGFALDEDALRRNNLVEFVGKSRTDRAIELRVSFPNSFPSNAPHVHTTTAVQLKRHQRPDTREICTFGPSRARWAAGLSGTAAIDEAEDVIAAMSGSPSSEQKYLDDVPEPASALYCYKNNTFIMVTPAISAFAARMSEGSSAQFKLRFENWPGETVSRTGPGRGIVTDLGDKWQVKAESWHERLVGSSLEIKGKIVRLAAPPPLVTSIPEFNAWLQNLGHERSDWMAFVFPEQSGNATTQRLAWLFVRSKHKLEHVRAFLMDGGGRAVRVPGLSSLVEKTVAFVGCGSLGSKIAASLAATGVNHFGLIDFDFLEPDNSVRHESGVNLFGFPKVLALQHRLFELNPEVFDKTKTLQMGIGGTNDMGKEKELQELLTQASLVVDTTGDHGVSRFLNDICAELNVPQVYASVSNGAWGGEVVRVIPGCTACWMCWFAQYESSRPSAEPAPEVGVFAPGCDQPTFTGTSYDLNIVAGLASSLVVDTLLIDDSGRKHYQGDYIRWQMRNLEGQFLPTTEVLPTDKRKPCPFCNPN